MHHGDIQARPGGYHHIVDQQGVTLTGEQRAEALRQLDQMQEMRDEALRNDDIRSARRWATRHLLLLEEIRNNEWRDMDEQEHQEGPAMVPENFQRARGPDESFYSGELTRNHERTPPMEMIGMVKLPRVIGYSLVAYQMNDREILYAVGCQMGTKDWWTDNLKSLLDKDGYGRGRKNHVGHLFWNAVALIEESLKANKAEEDVDDRTV